MTTARRAYGRMRWMLRTLSTQVRSALEASVSSCVTNTPFRGTRTGAPSRPT